MPWGTDSPFKEAGYREGPANHLHAMLTDPPLHGRIWTLECLH